VTCWAECVAVQAGETKGIAAHGSAIRLMVVDDHAIFRAALAAYLDSMPGLQVVATACCGREAVTLFGRSSRTSR